MRKSERSKLKSIIFGVSVVIVIVLISGNYTSYLSKAEAMRSNGVWAVDFAGTVYMSSGVIYGVIDTLKAQFDSTPEIPSYSDYFFSFFESDSNAIPDIPYNHTLVNMRLTVKCVEHNMVERTLLSEKISIAYLWAGGAIDADDSIYSFAYTLGPYVAQSDNSPLKIVAYLELDGAPKITKSYYLIIPNLTAGSE